MLQARELAQVNVPEQYLPLNISAARFNIEKAAYLGFAKAQTKMGAAYELCQLGCDFDPALSLHYNALAARQGEPDAEMSISKWFLCGYDGIFEKNDELAFIYARRATQSGFATAEFAMGYFFEIGMYVPVDLKEAKAWYSKASEHGNKDASARIEGITRSHTLSKKDHENVAIARIKSQYGSQKGRRPERFKNNQTPMPTIADGPIAMPDPNQSRPLAGTRLSPYPSQDDLPKRPVSVAPYPVDNESDQRNKQWPAHVGTSSFPQPYTRPESRPNSVASMGPPRLDTQHQSQSPAQMGPPRPLTGHGDMMGNVRGRSTPMFNTAPGPQGYRQPSSVLASPKTHSPAPLETPARPQSRVDIGFSAPPDLSGADRKRKLQKSDNSGAGTSRPLPTPSVYEAAPKPDPPRMSSMAHARTFSGTNQGPGPGRRPIPPSKQYESTPNLAGPGSPMTTTTPLPSVKPAGAPTATPPPSTATTRPPGKGPQTFEEMGVPQAKKDSECVSFITCR